MSQEDINKVIGKDLRDPMHNVRRERKEKEDARNSAIIKQNADMARASYIRENKLLSVRRQRNFGSRRSFFAFDDGDTVQRKTTIGG